MAMQMLSAGYHFRLSLLLTRHHQELVLLADRSPVTADHIRTWTRKDPDLALVLQFLRQGWPTILIFQQENRAIPPRRLPFVGDSGGGS